MNALLALLKDKRRAQEGSVLSAVLIIVAFLAIIAGALMTELSTSFLLSRNLVNRVNTEATVNSAVEVALNQLQSTPLNAACPSLSAVSLNGLTATPAYVSCWPTVDRRSTQFVPIGSSGAFNIDGSHYIIPNTSQDLYVVGDSGGTVYAYQFGQSVPTWTPRSMQSTITGPILAMQDAAGWPNNPPDVGTPPGGTNADIAYLVPISGGGGSGCAATCVVLLGQDVPAAPDVTCYMPTTATVTSRPAAGIAFPLLAFFGDSGGTLYAYNATEFCGSNPGTATLVANTTNPSNAAIVAGPVVLQNGARDEIYVVTSKGSTAQLLWYEYQQAPVSLTLKDTITLPFSNPVGLATENTAVAPRMAITFAGGGVAIYNSNANYDPSRAAYQQVAPGIGDAPYWCQCPSGNLIGVGGTNGTLYLRDTNLSAVASYAGGSAIRTTPVVDAAGNWFFGADDGNLYEVQLQGGVITLATSFGSAGVRIGSSPVASGCSTGICIYLGSTSSRDYLVPLDARDAILTACSGTHPCLWASVEIGIAGSPQMVHVQGWSYYSPP